MTETGRKNSGLWPLYLGSAVCGSDGLKTEYIAFPGYINTNRKKKLNFDQPNSEYKLNTELFLEKFFDHRYVLKPNQNM